MGRVPHVLQLLLAQLGNVHLRGVVVFIVRVAFVVVVDVEHCHLDLTGQARVASGTHTHTIPIC